VVRQLEVVVLVRRVFADGPLQVGLDRLAGAIGVFVQPEAPGDFMCRHDVLGALGPFVPAAVHHRLGIQRGDLRARFTAGRINLKNALPAGDGLVVLTAGFEYQRQRFVDGNVRLIDLDDFLVRELGYFLISECVQSVSQFGPKLDVPGIDLQPFFAGLGETSPVLAHAALLHPSLDRHELHARHLCATAVVVVLLVFGEPQ
jgi:hypothetical protein